jgi:hypothetical protein
MQLFDLLISLKKARLDTSRDNADNPPIQTSLFNRMNNWLATLQNTDRRAALWQWCACCSFAFSFYFYFSYTVRVADSLT